MLIVLGKSVVAGDGYFLDFDVISYWLTVTECVINFKVEGLFLP